MNAVSPLTAASYQWATRPGDQRFLDLDTMLAKMVRDRDRSVARVVSTRKLEVHPIDGDVKALAVVGKGFSSPMLPTHWSFGQVCDRAAAPASYMRRLPTPLTADCLNYGLLRNDAQEINLLTLEEDGADTFELRAATGPNYGRVWNSDIVGGLVSRFGDGRTGDFRVPGEFGRAVEVTKQNTTLYASDRDMFVFLADEQNRIEVPNRRGSLTGSLARGFFVWNSEVGSQTFGVATFLFDYVCSNRMVWGPEGYKEIRIRHTSSAPDKFIEEVTPALIEYSKSSTASIETAIDNARRARIDDVDAFLMKRFNKAQSTSIKLAHEKDEGRPIETIWDASNAITATAREIKHQDARVELERVGGKIFDLAQ